MAYTYETFNGIHGCPEIGNLTATLSHFYGQHDKPFALGGPRDPGSLFGKRLPYVTPKGIQTWQLEILYKWRF